MSHKVTTLIDTADTPHLGGLFKLHHYIPSDAVPCPTKRFTSTKATCGFITKRHNNVELITLINLNLIKDPYKILNEIEPFPDHTIFWLCTNKSATLEHRQGKKSVGILIMPLVKQLRAMYEYYGDPLQGGRWLASRLLPKLRDATLAMHGDIMVIRTDMKEP